MKIDLKILCEKNTKIKIRVVLIKIIKILKIPEKND